MNETDVREEIVRPLLHRLGYKYGEEAYIRTELTLKYPQAFLGRKKPKIDPPLRGRADYICGVAMEGRWVVEVKGSEEPLNRETVEQAHTYAAHPEVTAIFFLLTNGKRFQLFQTGILDKPVFDWTAEQLESSFIQLKNLVGPEAIKKHSRTLQIDLAKPLAINLPSRVRIVSGFAEYGEQKSSHPMLGAEAIAGVKLAIISGFVSRTDDGRIHSNLKMAEIAPLMKELNKVMGASEGYDFYSTSEYLSNDPEHPTLFENVVVISTPAGTVIDGIGASPFGIVCRAVTFVSGYLKGAFFCGAFEISQHYTFSGIPMMLRTQFPATAESSGTGTFEVELLQAPEALT